ncbi:MAG: hypothetical protein JWO06_1484 [Bacteroidota bacterium]|nr:hypothetical protein [Bacteroidota bacterium]
MKKKLSILAIALTFAFNTYAQNAWKTFTLPEGHYSVNFPGAPKESVQYDSSTAITFKINLALYEISETEVLMASATDMSLSQANEKSVKQFLEDSRDGATSSMGATKVTTLATMLTGDPYIEFTFSSDDFIGKERVYYIKGFQYSLISLFPLKKGIGPEADKFLKSFKHLN